MSLRKKDNWNWVTSITLLTSLIQITLSGLIFWKISNLSIGNSTGSEPNLQSEKPGDRIASSPVRFEGFPFKGNSNSKVVIIEFSDFECPFCKASQDTIKILQEKYKNEVRWVFRNYPISSLHRGSVGAAVAGLCAKDQTKFWEYHDVLFSIAKGDGSLKNPILKEVASNLKLDMIKFNSCMSSQKSLDLIQEDFQEATKLGVSGTPTFFVNNRMIIGNQPVEVFERIINEEIKKLK
jgi:protein-disulfide isomerase